jgi:hypothetical protein
LMVFNTTFNNISPISWRSALLVEDIGGPGENQRTVASHWQTVSHNVVHLAMIEIRTHTFYYFSSVVIFYFSFYLDLKAYYYVITSSILWNHRRSQKGIEIILVIQSLILVKEALIGWKKEIYSTDFERDENGILENAHFL